VTDDEAFIRCIVDSPGDDLPRLAYADWLDDRADPRGPYLRAEHEWAKPWRDGGRPATDPQLRALTFDLDSVWVARVSRPPVGVCIDRAVFRTCGPQVTDRDLENFETETGLPLTGDYRAFLLNVNGGIPVAQWRAERETDAEACRQQCFYSLGEAVPESRNLLDRVRRFRGLIPEILTEDLWDAGSDDPPWQADAVPIGGDNAYFTLFYAVRGMYTGRLHLHDYTGEWCRFGWIAGPLKPPTLPQYLCRFVEHGQSIADTYPSQPLQEFWKL